MERMIMLNVDNDSLKNELLLEKAVLYKNNKDYGLALQTLKRISKQAATPSVKAPKIVGRNYT
jgi:hypothetical protein